MSESEKSPTNMPTIVVVVLAMLGLAAFPQGGGKISEARPKVEASAAGDASAVEEAKDEDDLGPLATVKAERLPEKLESISSTCNPDSPRTVSNSLSEKLSNALLRAEHGLRFLIVLVPDPDHTSMSHEFDLTLSAALRATESAGFVATRWSGMPGFPPTRKDASQDGTNPAVARVKGTAAGKSVDLAVDNKSSSPGLKWPAAVLSRPTPNRDSDLSIRLLTLLVPESPTLGIDKERLVAAIELIDTHGRLHEACVHTDGCHHVPCTYQPVRIVGPSFSGSMSSFAKVLLHFIPDDPLPAKMPRFVIYNGRSTSPDLQQLWKKQPGAIRFKSTVYTNLQISMAVRDYVKTITPAFAAPPRFAVLVESNTGFGQKSTQDSKSSTKGGRAEFFSFPLNISRIREEYAAKGFFSSNEPMKLQSPNRLSPLEMAGVRGQHDLIPVVSPGPSAVVGELALSQIILALERGHFNWVAILATNPYDRLFLAEQVRLACSDTRLYLVSASTLYAHHTATPYLRGAIVASTYPLDPVSQTWTASPGWRAGNPVAQLSFGNDYDEGIYNATIAHLSDLKLDKTPDLLDYAYPGADSEPNAVPPVWISVVGQRSLYPVQVQPPKKDWIAAPDPKYPEVGGLYTAPENQPPPEEMKKAKLDSNWTAILITAAFASIVVSLWYLRVVLSVDKTSLVGRWPRWAVSSPGVRQVIDHHSARKLATAGASAGLGQMILLSAPVWVLALPDILVAASLSQRCLMIGISVLALLGLGTSAVVALFRMLFADRNRNVGLGESIYRGIVAAAALAQVALPFYLVVWMGRLDAANLRLCFVRTTRLVNGVTPMIPFLVLGVAGGVVMIGDWRRVGLRVRMNATGEASELSSGPLSAVWSGFKATRRALDKPLTAWGDAGFLATLPLWVSLALVGVVLANGMPNAVEPYPMFLYAFLLAFAVTLGLLVVRLVDLMGLLPRVDRLLRQLAAIPMVRAFDRMPALFATENFWRHTASETSAEDDTDPRIDRQFEAVVVGYLSNLQAIRIEKRLHFVDLERLDNLLRACSPTGRLPTKEWWPAVNALTPLLAPFWASRPAVPGPAERDKKSSGDELADWPGVENQELRTWLRSAEDLVAMVMVRQLAWLRASVQTIISFLVAGLVITFLVLTSYPFEPQEPIFALLGVLTVITVGFIVVIAVQASRDEVLSRLNKTPTDRFTFDRHFLTTMITFVVPLLGLLGALSYSLSDLFRSLFEPFFRGG